MIEITDSIDKKKWDEFVFNHPQGNIFQTSDMAEVYRLTKNYEPISLAAVDNESGEILALIQSVVIREMSGLIGSFSARSIIQGGPLYINNDEGFKAASSLVDHYEHIIHGKAIYTQIRNTHDDSKIKKVFEKAGYLYEGHLNYQIKLDRDENEIWKDIHNSRRRGINRAMKNGIEILTISNENEILPFYNILKETYQNVSIPLADISLFKSAFNILAPKNMAKFYLAKNDNTPTGARVVLIYKGLLFDWYAGSLKSYSNMRINETLVWYILKMHANNDFKSFDFGGAGRPDEEYGVREFKKSFGGDLENFGRYVKTHSQSNKFVADLGFNIYKKIIKL